MIPVRIDDHPAAEMDAARILVFVLQIEDGFDARQLGLPVALFQAAAHDGDRGSPLGRARQAQIDLLIFLESGVQLDIEQSALAAPRFTEAAKNTGHALDGLRNLAGLIDDPQPAVIALGYEDAAVGEEGEGPGMDKVARDHARLDGP